MGGTDVKRGLCWRLVNFDQTRFTEVPRPRVLTNVDIQGAGDCLKCDSIEECLFVKTKRRGWEFKTSGPLVGNTVEEMNAPLSGSATTNSRRMCAPNIRSDLPNKRNYHWPPKLGTFMQITKFRSGLFIAWEQIAVHLQRAQNILARLVKGLAE